MLSIYKHARASVLLVTLAACAHSIKNKNTVLTAMCTTVLGVVALGPVLVRALYIKKVATPVDPNISKAVVESVEALLSKRVFIGKRVLVIGGTKGIGRGIAVRLAEAGASVEIVGRSGGDEVVRRMSKKALDVEAAKVDGKVPDFRFHCADMSTLDGCFALTRGLVGTYDALVMTMGVWPDYVNPLTRDGYDKMIFIDIIARFAVFDGLSKRGLLTKNAQVVNVLGSGQKYTPKADTESSLRYMKALHQCYSSEEERATYKPDPKVMNIVASTCISADAFLLQAASRYPDLAFIGTMPGIITTNLLDNTFSKISNIASHIIKNALGMTMTEEECGLNHLNIMASQRLANNQMSLWDHFLIGRMPNKLAANEDYSNWLWETLECIVANHAQGRSQSIKKHQ